VFYMLYYLSIHVYVCVSWTLISGQYSREDVTRYDRGRRAEREALQATATAGYIYLLYAYALLYIYVLCRLSISLYMCMCVCCGA